MFSQTLILFDKDALGVGWTNKKNILYCIIKDGYDSYEF